MEPTTNVFLYFTKNKWQWKHVSKSVRSINHSSYSLLFEFSRQMKWERDPLDIWSWKELSFSIRHIHFTHQKCHEAFPQTNVKIFASTLSETLIENVQSSRSCVISSSSIQVKIYNLSYNAHSACPRGVNRACINSLLYRSCKFLVSNITLLLVK